MGQRKDSGVRPTAARSNLPPSLQLTPRAYAREYNKGIFCLDLNTGWGRGLAGGESAHTSSHLIHNPTQGCYYHRHFTVGETEAQRG